jgi:predicted ferric reductase
VSSADQLTPRKREVTVGPDGDRGLEHKAGQFVWLNIGHSSFSIKENPFSLCSAPAGGPQISFTIKKLGDFTRTIGRIKPDTPAYLDGHYGISLLTDGPNRGSLSSPAG